MHDARGCKTSEVEVLQVHSQKHSNFVRRTVCDICTKRTNENVVGWHFRPWFVCLEHRMPRPPWQKLRFNLDKSFGSLLRVSNTPKTRLLLSLPSIEPITSAAIQGIVQHLATSCWFSVQLIDVQTFNFCHPIVGALGPSSTRAAKNQQQSDEKIQEPH